MERCATRGNIIDKPALIDALEAGYLSGAVLDVSKQAFHAWHATTMRL